MNEDEEVKKILISARDYFLAKNYESSKEKLESIKQSNIPIEINLLLIEHKINKDNADMVLNALMKLLTQQDIKLYTERYVNPNRTQLRQLRHVDHQYLYWNIIVIALKIGRPAVASLVANEASFFYGSFKTQTSLYILSELLLSHLYSSTLASFVSFLGKYQRIAKLALKLQRKQQQYSTLSKILYIRLLLKLKMINEAQGTYLMSFNQIDNQAFIDNRLQNVDLKNQLTFEVYKQFVHAQLEFTNHNFKNSMQILAQFLCNDENNKQINRVKILAENNIALIFYLNDKQILAKKYLIAVCEKLSRSFHDSETEDTQRLYHYEKVKENLLYTYLKQTTIQPIQEAYVMLSHFTMSQSYKLSYRKAQICLKYYHLLLEKGERLLPWQEIYDNYETIYYYPNQPYVQQKGKNKNNFFPNKKFVYKRYILSPWESSYNDHQQLPDRDIDRKNFQRQANNLKLKQILQKTQHFLKQALVILNSQIRVSQQRFFHEYEGDYHSQINELIFKEHTLYITSILAILCYVQISLCQWAKCIAYGRQFMQEKNAQRSQDFNSVLMYMMEAYCQIGNFTQAYEITNKLMRANLKQQRKYQVRDSRCLSSSIFSQSDQVNIFLYNVAVLHSRDNHIPQSYQCIQKIHTHQRISPNMSQTNMPLPLVDLMIHYNLRIQNYSSALQMIKRKRILTMQGVNGIRSLLNITK